MTFYRRQESRPSPKKEMQKAKWLFEEALQIAKKRREARRKGKIHPLECRVAKNSKET